MEGRGGGEGWRRRSRGREEVEGRRWRGEEQEGRGAGGERSRRVEEEEGRGGGATREEERGGG